MFSLPQRPRSEAPRETSTEVSYSNTVRLLARRASGNVVSDPVDRLAVTCRWFASQDGAWGASTIRQYRAALLFAIDDLPRVCDASVDVRGHLHALLRTGPSPRQAGVRPRTSAKKRRFFSRAEWDVLLRHLKSRRRADATADALFGVIAFGPILGLRPSEWAQARLAGDRLIIRSRKCTRGRGIPWRSIELGRLGPDLRDELAHFLKLLASLTADAPSRQVLHERLSKRLHRICLDLGIPPICLYTTRHQAIATAKRTLDPRSVAALAGHISTRTATSHYAKRRSGWRLRLDVCPAKETCHAVRTSPHWHFVPTDKRPPPARAGPDP